MPACSAYGCTQRTKTVDASLHRFPKNPDLRRKWIDAVRRKDFVPSETAVLCTRHFREEDVDRTGLASVRLRENAVPSVFTAFPSYLQKVKKTRKPPMQRLTASETSGVASADQRGNSELQQLRNEHVEYGETSTVSNTNKSLESVRTAQLSSENADLSSTDDNPLVVACKTDTISQCGTPRQKALKRKIGCLQVSLANTRKKVKVLQQTKRRLVKKNANLTSVLSKLRNKNLLGSDSLEILEKSAGGIGDLLRGMVNKKSQNPIPTSYSPELRSFALTLHFFSPHAYRYVRDVFNTCLPHPRTIERWYTSVDGQPGFTSH